MIYWEKVWSERSKQQQSSGASGGTYYTANEMKVLCSNPNLSYSQNPRFRVRVSPPNLSFL